MKLYILLFFFLFSCNLKNIKVENKHYSIEYGSVAVLPFDNMSNDITAEDMMRVLVIEAFKRKGWNVLDKNLVDEKLRYIGITDGGQLVSVSTKELVEQFNTRYLCYGVINEFKFQNLGFFITKKVELNIKIFDSVKGEFIFDETGVGIDTKVYLDKDEAKKAFIRYNALKLVENMMKRPLYQQALDCVNRIFSKF